MIDVRVATKEDVGKPCRGCSQKIKRGQPVMVIKLPFNTGLPYDARYQFVHGSCVSLAMALMPPSAAEEDFAAVLAEYGL